MDFFKVFAPFYDSFMHLVGHEKSISKVIDNIDKEHHKHILDIGGGTGSLALKLQEYDCNVIVVDVSKKMLEQARKKGLPEDNLIVGDATQLPFDSNEFDLVFCTDALHHFSDKEGSLKEMARVLKKEGSLIVLDFNRKKLFIKVLEIVERIVGEPTEFYTPLFLSEQLEGCGLKGKIKYINSYQFLYVGKKVNDIGCR